MHGGYVCEKNEFNFICVVFEVLKWGPLIQERFLERGT